MAKAFNKLIKTFGQYLFFNQSNRDLKNKYKSLKKRKLFSQQRKSQIQVLGNHDHA